MKPKNHKLMRRIGFIFDIDGVIVDSPHEEAWRTTLKNFGVEKFSPQDYLETAAGRPREEGARKIFKKFGINFGKNDEVLHRFCEKKQFLVNDLIEKRKFKLFVGSILFILKAKKDNVPIAAASSSKNAKHILEMIDMYSFNKENDLRYEFIKSGTTLYDLFDADVCGLDIKPGKPHPKIFLVAADLLGIPHKQCVVFEDAISGIEAAKNAGMFCVGIRRIGKKNDLINAGADIVINDLNELPYEILKKRLI